MSNEEARGRGARAAVRVAGHKASGGHAMQTIRNRVIRDPNAPDQPRHERHRMTYVPYPKWLHFDGEPSLLVRNAAEHEAALAAHAAPEKRGPGRPKKAVEPVSLDPSPDEA